MCDDEQLDDDDDDDDDNDDDDDDDDDDDVEHDKAQGAPICEWDLMMASTHRPNHSIPHHLLLTVWSPLEDSTNI